MISLSGIDCSGKSTQINNLINDLKLHGLKCRYVWSRGGYTPGIEILKKIVRPNAPKDRDAKIQFSQKFISNRKRAKVFLIVSIIDLCLYYTINLRIMSVFREVICDRYIWDTLIDFKIKFPTIKFENWTIWKLTLKMMKKPDISICLYLSAEESMRRSKMKFEPFPENIEQRMTRIREYEQEMKEKRWDNIIDASASTDAVYGEIKDVIKNLYPQLSNHQT